jgi:hypothetical protein
MEDDTQGQAQGEEGGEEGLNMHNIEDEDNDESSFRQHQ